MSDRRISSLALIVFCLTGSAVFVNGSSAPTPAAPGKPRTNRVKITPTPLPEPNDVKTLSVHRPRIILRGADDAQQLIVMAELARGTNGSSAVLRKDLTGAVKYEVANKSIVRVTPSGRVIPLTNGSTTVTARYGDKEVKITVETEDVDKALPINFANHIVPIFTKLGCNAGGCHGKLSGQNGFKLSLLGFEPEADFDALVKEARGRRVFPAAPEHSLLLRKASGRMPHGGGKRCDTDSDEYKLLYRWIASGTPWGNTDDPTITHLSIYPEHHAMTRGDRQQIATYAHYSDGSIVDVTRRAQYESNDLDVASVDTTGLVQSQTQSGEAAIMARYQGKVTVFRVTVPLGMEIPKYTFEPRNFIDHYTHKKWQQLGIAPSEPCTDEAFIRRVSLDIAGTLPTPRQVKAFLEDTTPDKRDKLVDSLLASPEYSYHFANKWADILRVKRGPDTSRTAGAFAFHEWIRESIAADKPYDVFTRELLGAVGDESRCPPVVWYKDVRTPDQFVDNASQVFLGVRMACAQCHHHPYEKWGQDDYWGLAAYFGRVGRKTVNLPSPTGQNQQQRQVVFNRGRGTVANKRTNQPAPFKPLDGAPVEVDADDDPRQKLVDWMVAADNPFFARAVVNRYWAHFLGRGIVHPLDDMRITNPPSNPELLDALAKDFVENNYSLKHLVAVICKSRTYQLSSTPNKYNRHDRQAYARYYPRRLSAEVLFDAVCQVTNSPGSFSGLPQDTHAPRRALMLPHEAFPSYFLDVFGRPQRLSACECERVTEANLAQTLHLLNSDEVQGKLSRAGGRADLLAKDARPDEEKIEEMFLWAFARKPTPPQLEAALEHLKENHKNKKAAYENLLWALINTKEFVFNR